MPMATRTVKFEWIPLVAVATIALFACKRESDAAARPDSDSALEQGTGSGSSGEPGFTSAEIRREKPVEIDTAGLVPPATVAPSAQPDNQPDKNAKVEPAKPAQPVSVQPAKPVAAPASPETPSAQVRPSSASVDGAPVPGETGDWVLQVNVHRSEAEAKTQIAKLGQVGIPAYAVPVPTGDANLSGNYWRVRVGRFSSRADAQKYGTSVLEPKGLKFWIDRKANENRQGT